MGSPSPEPEPKPSPTLLEAMRRRPAMYIGSLGPRGLQALANEAIDNAVEEAVAGHASRVDVTLHADGSLSVSDDGRGLPVEADPETGEPWVTRILTSRGVWPHPEPRMACGESFCGIHAVNGLAAWLEVTIRQEQALYRQRFERGLPVTPLESAARAGQAGGTTLRWLADPEIFGDDRNEPARLRNRLRTLACLAPGLRLSLTDEGMGTRHEFHQPGGMADLLDLLNTGATPLSPPISVRHRQEKFHLDAAIQHYSAPYRPAAAWIGFANHRNVSAGGWHFEGLKRGVAEALEEMRTRFADEHPIEQRFRLPLAPRELCAAISLRIPGPAFEGATKERLGSDDPAADIDRMAEVVAAGVSEQLEQDRSQRDHFVQKVWR